ncbi:hypothetical protein EAI_14354 [Harpegnathos saltator]|uniref:Uncharacterized protein n=1 Tax=Harpegnathos saltator TaxID=610380 RepID=E2BGF6_HARSA|nr:hypothetical protein EAI_14354 [Harpegnathos saltator]
MPDHYHIDPKILRAFQLVFFVDKIGITGSGGARALTSEYRPARISTNIAHEEEIKGNGPAKLKRALSSFLSSPVLTAERSRPPFDLAKKRTHADILEVNAGFMKLLLILWKSEDCLVKMSWISVHLVHDMCYATELYEYQGRKRSATEAILPDHSPALQRSSRRYIDNNSMEQGAVTRTNEEEERNPVILVPDDDYIISVFQKKGNVIGNDIIEYIAGKNPRTAKHSMPCLIDQALDEELHTLAKAVNEKLQHTHFYGEPSIHCTLWEILLESENIILLMLFVHVAYKIYEN